MLRAFAILVLALGLAGCGSRGLMDLRVNHDGPDEFLVLPVKPLSMPASFGALPQPTPGGGNLTDPNPKGEAVAALGGRSELVGATAVPATDAALVAQAGRHGVQPDIRQTLATEDAQFRKRQSRFTRLRLFKTDRYRQAYRRQVIEPFDEAAEYRRRGYPTPSSPPAGR